MASDFSKPVVGDAYATLLPGIVTMFQDLARGLEPTLTGASTNTPTGTIRWNAATNLWERYNGASWAALAATYAISITGNAATATKSTNIASGAAGGIPYQTGVDATAFLAAGTAGQILLSNGTAAPTWTNQSSITAGAAPWSGISGKPTTVAGYGITDAITTGNIGSQAVASATSATNATNATNVTGTVGSAATGTTQAATDNSTKIATTAMVQATAIGGVGKSWQVVTRAFGTTYTAPAYPIVMKIQTQSSASPGGGVGISINSGSVINISWGAAQTVGEIGIGEIEIPAGATYLISAIGVSTSITTVWELR